MKNLNNDVWHSVATQSDEQKVKNQNSKFAWCLTGSGHYLKESIQLLDKMPDTDIFLSRRQRKYYQCTDTGLMISS